MVAGAVPGGILRFGPFRLDLQQRLLFRETEPLHLPPKVLDLLAALAAEPQRVIAKEKLVQSVWPDVTVEEGNLTKGIHLLRRTLGQRPDGGEWIETVSKRGYRLAADVVHDNAVPAPPPESNVTRVHPDAQRWYADGRYLLMRRPGPAFERALAAFERAVQIDPHFPEAWAALAEAHAMLGSWESGVRAPLEAMSEAHRLAARAISLAPDLADAHATLGYATLHFDWNAEAATRSFRRALELDRGHARAHHWLAHAHLAAGRTAEAEASSSRAVESDPLDLILKVHFAWHWAMAGDAARTLESAESVLALDPAFHWGHYFAGWALEDLGETARAVDERTRAVELAADARVMRAGLAVSLAKAGDAKRSRAEIESISRAADDPTRFAYDAALVALALGERETALERLSEAIRARSPWIAYLAVDPRLRPLRDDARFRELVTLARPQ